MDNSEKKKERKGFSAIGKKLKERADSVSGYEVSADRKADSSYFYSSVVSRGEYQRARKLKKQLIENYRGAKLEDVIPGDEFKSQVGECYRIKTEEEISLPMVDSGKAKQGILSNLKLVYGIGRVTESKLKKSGIERIDDLVGDSCFEETARAFLEILDSNDPCKIIEEMTHWLPTTHPHVLFSSSLFNVEDFLFVDIETMGLFTRPIILIGVAEINGSTFTITQYLLRNIGEEPAALHGFLSHLSDGKIFVSFNGKSFDIPYINERLRYYGVFDNPGGAHLDLLHFSRRAWSEKLSDCQLKTLEKFLFGIERVDDVPSEMVPDFYEEYEKTGNPGPLIPIIEHNRQDIVTLARIFGRLHEKWAKYC